MLQTPQRPVTRQSASGLAQPVIRPTDKTSHFAVNEGNVTHSPAQADLASGSQASAEATTSPFYAFASVGLVVLMLDALCFGDAATRWIVAGGCTGLLAVVALAWVAEKNQTTTQKKSPCFQRAILAGGVALAVLLHTVGATDSSTRLFLALPLAASVLCHSFARCLIANGAIAAAWLFTLSWNGQPWTSSGLVNHGFLLPLLSCTFLMVRAQRHPPYGSEPQDEQHCSQAMVDAMRLVVKEASRRAKTDAQLREQKRFLDRVLDTIQDQFLFKDREGRITHMNSAFREFYELDQNACLGRCASECLPKEFSDKSNETDQAVLEEGCSLRFEQRVRSARGTICTLETIKTPLQNESGEIIGLIEVSRDATARRSAEEEVAQQKELLEQIIQTVPDELFVKDCDRRLVMANESYYKDLNLRPDDILGKNPESLLPSGIPSVSRETDTLVLEHAESVYREIRYVDAQGNERFDEIRKLPLTVNGKIVGIVGLCRDVTARKQAEQRVREQEALLLHATRLSSLGEVVAGIAHEVNQPLFSILNYTKAIENTLNSNAALASTPIRRWIEQILREATRGGKITQRLRSVLKPAESVRELAKINEIVNESIDLFEDEAHRAGVSIETDFEEGDPTITVDRVQVQQVLMNLFKNSLEAFPRNITSKTPQQTEAASRIHVSTRNLPSGVEISVADNGHGLAKNEDKAILEPFHTTKRDGTGLGLAISNTIVEAHNGHLSFGANDWGGATFRFTLGNE